MKSYFLALLLLLSCDPSRDYERQRQPAGGTRFDCPRCGSLTQCEGCRAGNEDSWRS